MVKSAYRSTKHPKLPDTFERLRAQAQEEPKTTDPIQTWLTQTTLPSSTSYAPLQPAYHHTRNPSNLPPPSSSTRQLRPSRLTSPRVSVLPLQPTHGNRPPPPTSTCVRRKRKMPDNSHTDPRQSTRNKKNIQSTSADDGASVKGKEHVVTRASHRQRKVDSKTRENDLFDVAEDTLEDGRPSSLENSMPGGGRPVRGMGLSNDSVFGEGLVRLPMALSTPSKASSSRSKKSGSPTKGLIVGKRERMKFMEPHITFKTLVNTNKSGDLTGKLQKLWQHLNWHERKVIPSAFKMEVQSQFDTPNKTKPLIPNDCFGAPQDKYATDDYALMRLTIADLLDSADEYRHSGCTESHWSSIVVSPLLNLVRRLGRYQKTDSKLAVLDLTSVEISPSTLCSTSSDSLFKDLDKRIDAGIGLNLPCKKREILEEGVYSEGIPSINQTASFVNFVPLFVNIEVKRPNTDRDPLIQLGTWIAAEFKKRQKEGYSLDMPVLAIEIEGDDWKLHMVFAPEDAESGTFECKFVGPIEMGSTRSLLGVYQILDRLCCCADWGIGEYQTWFNEQVLARYGK